MDFFKKSKANLVDFVKEPSLPWANRVVISAAGIIVSGWTLDNKVFLLSADGYSVSDPITGQREIRNYDEDNSAMSKFSKDNLEFTVDELGQTIKIFGLRGGDGNHCTTDFWDLTSFSPSLGEQIVGIRNMRTRQNQTEYWKEFELISLTRLEYTALKFGFSPFWFRWSGNIYKTMRKTSANSTLAIGGVSSPLDSFVVTESSVLRTNF